MRKRTLPVARKNGANANGSKSENCSKHVSVTSKPITSNLSTEVEPPQGCHHILPPVTSRGRSHHIRQEGSSRAKGLFPLTRVEGLSRLSSDQFLLTMEVASSQASAMYPRTTEGDSFQDRNPFPLTKFQGLSRTSDQFLPTMEVANYQANAPYPHTTEEDSSRTSALCPHTMEEDSCLTRGPSPHTSPVEHFLANALFRLTTGVELCQATNLSPRIWVVEISQAPLLPRITPTPTTGPPIMKSRGEWVI